MDKSNIVKVFAEATDILKNSPDILFRNQETLHKIIDMLTAD